MAVTGQTFAERFAAVGAVVTFDSTDYIRVGEDLVTVADFVSTLKTLGGLLSGSEIDLPDAGTTFVVRGASVTPSQAVFQVENFDGDILAATHSSWVEPTEGIVSALNQLNDRLWITSDQTEPAWSNGQWWLRPRV